MRTKPPWPRNASRSLRFIIASGASRPIGPASSSSGTSSIVTARTGFVSIFMSDVGDASGRSADESASANAVTLWKRRSGSFSSALRIARDAATGIAGSTALGARGGSERCFIRTDIHDEPVNGTNPVSIS